MKSLVLALVLCFSLSASAASLVQAPATNSDNSVTPSASGVKAMTLNGAASAMTLDIEGNASSGNPALNINAQDYDAADIFTQSGWGLYTGSTSGYGLYATSYNSTSAVFQSSASSDSQPTVIIAGMGGSADLLQFQDINGTTLSSVDQNGVFHASKGMSAVVSSLPSCGVSSEGLLVVQKASGGNPTKLELCSNDGSGNYSWVTK